MLFSFLSIASLLTLRRPILRRLNARSADQPEIDSLVGQTVILLSDLAPCVVGKAELRGTSWSAENGGSETLTKGQRCVVEAVDGLKLKVRANHPAG